MIGMICYQSYRESSAVESAQNISISEEQIILQGKKKGVTRSVKVYVLYAHSIALCKLITSSSNLSLVPPYSGTNTLSPTATEIGIISPS